MRARSIVAVLLASSPAMAGDDEAAEAVVHGERASGFVSRARVDDSRRVVTDAASLLEPLPGVHVRRLGGDDAFATLSIRGSTSSQVAVVLGGVPLTGGADPTLDLATLPLWPGARADVYRSFAPAALGRGSLGGTLALDPPSPRAKPRTDLWLAAGAFGARRLRVGSIAEIGDARVATGLSASRADDDFSYFDWTSGATSTRENAGHAGASGLVAIALPVRFSNGTGALTTTTLVQGRKQELPGSIKYPTPAQSLASSRLVSSVELSVPLQALTGIARVWGRREELAITDHLGRIPIGPRPTATDDAILAIGTSTGVRARSDRASIEARVDGSLERFAPGRWVLVPAPPAARRSNAGLALDASFRRFATVAGSARLDGWADAADGESKTYVRPTGHAGVEAPIGPVLAATHAGWVTRPPSFVERYGNRGAFLGDPALRPESAFTVDLGGRWQRRFGPVDARAELAGFATWASDLITYVFQGGEGRSKATNIGSARLLGMEAEARAIAFGFDMRVSYTGLATANQSACRSVDGPCERPPLPGRPTTDLVVDLAYAAGPVRARYGIDAVAGMFYDSEGALEVPPRALHSAGLTLALPSGVSLAADVRNLFDLRVADYVGTTGPARRPIGDFFDYPLPGRRVLVSVSASFP
jgi:vitamin B12 transporter